MCHFICSMTSAVDSLKEAIVSNDDSKIQSSKSAFLSAAQDPISQWLDREKGSTVKDNRIFTSLPRFWEKEFQNDMKALNVRINYFSLVIFSLLVLERKNITYYSF